MRRTVDGVFLTNALRKETADDETIQIPDFTETELKKL